VLKSNIATKKILKNSYKKTKTKTGLKYTTDVKKKVFFLFCILQILRQKEAYEQMKRSYTTTK